MTSALVDTNVWLDIILSRPEHFDASANVVNLLARPEHSAYVAGHTVTTIYYLVAKARDERKAMTAVRALLDDAVVAAVGGMELREAAQSDIDDFEDAVVAAAARRAGIDAIITRNAADFRKSRLAVYTPVEFVTSFGR